MRLHFTNRGMWKPAVRVLPHMSIHLVQQKMLIIMHGPHVQLCTHIPYNHHHIGWASVKDLHSAMHDDLY